MHEIHAPIRVLLYARVSSPEQKRRRDSDRDEPSLGEQFAAMEREAERRGWLIVERCEDTVTGATPVRERPGGAGVYARAQDDAFDVMMVYDNDRIGRDQDALVAKVFRVDLRRLKKQIYSVYQPVEPTPPTRYEPWGNDSELWLETVSDTASSIYVRQFCRRRAFGMKKRVEDKKLMPGKLPIGYTAERHVLPSGRAILGPRCADPVYGPIVKRIFGDYEAGLSAQQLAVALNGDCLRTPAGNYWTAGTIHGIVANPVYYGAVVYQKHRSDGPPDPRYPGRRISRNQPIESWVIVEDGQHPALISQEQWRKVQAVRRSRIQGTGRTFGERTLLSGLVECGRCGAAMNRSGSWSGGYWVCSHARRTGGTGCDRKHIQVRWVESQTLTYLKALTTDPTLLRQLSFEPRHLDPAAAEQEVASLHGRLADLDRRLAKARDAYEAGIDSLTEYASRKAELERERQSLSDRVTAAELAREGSNTTDLPSLAAMLAEFATNLRNHPLPHQKVILREVIDKVVVTPDRLHIRFRTDVVRPSEYNRIIKMIQAYSDNCEPSAA